VVGSVLRADLKATVDQNRFSGLRMWAFAIARFLILPSCHAVLMYRLSHALYGHLPTKPLAFLVRTVCTVWSGTEIHPAAVIGPGLCLVHSQKVLIGKGVVIGERARICHGVSIGGDMGLVQPRQVHASPHLGDDVVVGMDAIIMGPVTVGDNVLIGAQALVLDDIPSNAVAAGSPASVKRFREPGDDSSEVAIR